MLAVLSTTLCQLGLAQGSAAVEKPATVPMQKAITSLPKVRQIDIKGLKPLLKPTGKPLLVNFWATWCDPCREEFPDLVKISAEFQGKVDFITVSLDDLADINTYVPKFLKDMNSNIPAYLLHTPNEAEELGLIFKDWKGNLPLTVLFNSDGAVTYERNGKIWPDVLRENIRKLVPVEQPK
jgi:thiol-disulfide isomerase/thioredoxin